MTTARQVIKSALRKILSYGTGEEPSAQEMTDGLEGLNDLMSNLTVMGARISFKALALDDTVNLDDAHIRTIKAQLAVELAPEFGAAVDPQVAFVAREGMKALQADTTLAVSTPIDSALLRSYRC